MKKETFASAEKPFVLHLPKRAIVKSVLCLVALFGLFVNSAFAQDWYLRGNTFEQMDKDMTYKLAETAAGSGIFQVTAPLSKGNVAFVFANENWNKYASNEDGRIAYTGGLLYDNGSNILFEAPVAGDYIFELNTNTLTYKITVPWTNMPVFYAAGDWLGNKGDDFGPTITNDFKLSIDNNGIGSVVLHNVTPGEHTFQITTAWDINYKWDADNNKITTGGSAPIPTPNLAGGTYTLKFDFNTLTFTLEPGNTLPVTFGTISANISGQRTLTVNWTTLSETNNEFFNVEVSTDGKNFVNAGTVLSKAGDGNSSSSLDYTFQFTLDSTANKALAGSLIFALVLGTLAMSGRKIKPALAALALTAISTTALYSCTKGSNEPVPTDQTPVFVRIVQVDKDGGSKTSDVVKAFVR